MTRFSQVLTRHLVRHVAATRKLVVLDCDNTLWGGAVAEAGVEGVTIDAPFLALQRFFLDLQGKQPQHEIHHQGQNKQNTLGDVIFHPASKCDGYASLELTTVRPAVFSQRAEWFSAFAAATRRRMYWRSLSGAAICC